MISSEVLGFLGRGLEKKRPIERVDKMWRGGRGRGGGGGSHNAIRLMILCYGARAWGRVGLAGWDQALGGVIGEYHTRRLVKSLQLCNMWFGGGSADVSFLG